LHKQNENCEAQDNEEMLNISGTTEVQQCNCQEGDAYLEGKCSRTLGVYHLRLCIFIQS